MNSSSHISARLNHGRWAVVVIVTLALCVIQPAAAAEPWETFLDTWCIRCHGAQKVEGDLRIDTLSRHQQGAWYCLAD